MSSKRHFASPRRALATLCFALLTALTYAAPARALDEEAGDAQKLKSCDERVCAMLLTKNPIGEDLKCELSKTWAKSTIKEAERRNLTWGFGDARCTVKLDVSRATVVAAVSSPEFKFFVPPHTVNCVVEQEGKLEKVKATLAPKIVFKDGKAEKVWVNLTNVDGPAGVKATLWTAAQLNDGIGIFHRPLLKAINRFIAKHCPTHYPQLAAKSPAAKK
jgi:hypothetical protein